MKIIIGGGDGQTRRRVQLHVRPISTEDRRKVEREFEDGLWRELMHETVELSRVRLRRLKRTIEAEAMMEAMNIFPTIANVIEQNQRGISAYGGHITWKPLTRKYVQWKSNRLASRAVRRLGRRAGPKQFALARSRASSSERFFVLDGDLLRYFQRNGASIVTNRYGGIHVTVDERGAATRPMVFDRKRGLKREIGRLEVKIFPKIAPSLMPMLASRQWTAVPNRGHFEAAMLPPGAAKKLSGGGGPVGRSGPMARGNNYRPLVLPITQLFIIHRIPQKIRDAVRKSVRSQSEK